MKEFFYIGGYTNSINIYVFENGKINFINEIKGIKNPSYLNINKNFIYSVEEQENGKIVSYKINDNDLNFINSIDINASMPCYITSDKKRENLLVANYESGSMIVFELKMDGSIGKEKYRISYTNKSNIHFAEFIDGKIYVVDLGNDSVYIYNLQMSLLYTIKVEKGAGPRHLVVTDRGNTIYIVTEYSNQVLMYVKENDDYILKQKISTIRNKNIETYASAIILSKDNKNIYITNRGENTISVFEIINNKLKLVQTISSYGDYPRDIILSENEQYVIVANQKSDNIAIFTRNPSDGKLLIYKDEAIKVEKPSCIKGRKI